MTPGGGESRAGRTKENGLVNRVSLRASIVCLGALLLLSATAQATEVLYFLSPAKDTPPDQRRTLKDVDGDPIQMSAEPVAKITSDQVKEARIVTEKIEVVDEDEPVSELYRVVLVLDDADNAKISKTMDELCKTRPGVHIAVDDTVVDYRPFAVCGKFQTAISFLDKPSAEQFANKVSKKVTVVTPAAE